MDKFKFDFDGVEYTLQEPKAYHFLMVSDFRNNPETPDKFKGESFLGLYLIFVSLVNGDNELSDVITYMKFLKTLDLAGMKRLETAAKTFRDSLLPEKIDTDNKAK